MKAFFYSRKIKNLGIGKKFLIIVITSLLSVGVVGLFSVKFAQKRLESLKIVYKNGQIVEQISSKLIQPINDIHSSSIFLVMNPSKNELQNIDGRIQLLIHHVDGELASSIKQYPGFQEDHTYNELRVLWDLYKVKVNETRVLVDQNDISDARKIVFNDAKVKFQRLISILSIRQKDHIQFSENEYSKNIVEAKKNTDLIIFLILLSTSSVIFISYRLVQLIVNPIKKITETASKIAHGDLSQFVPVDSEDEIGVLAKTFNLMSLKVEKLNKDLESKVKRRTLELNDKTELLKTQLTEVKNLQEKIIAQEKITSLALLLSGVSHEIRNPLNIIENSSIIIKNSIEEIELELDPEKKNKLYVENIKNIEELTEIVVKQSQRANRIITSMLSQSLGVSAEVESVNIKEIINKNLSYVEKLVENSFLERTKVTKDFDYSGSINLYEQEFGQVITNIFENAFYAMKKKMDDMENNSSYSPELIIKSSQKEGNLIITVRDNGVGVSKEIIDEIFVAFRTTKPMGEGTGLGLSVCLDIVKKHNGTISVDSVEGEFTQFIIVLPKSLT